MKVDLYVEDTLELKDVDGKPKKIPAIVGKDLTIGKITFVLWGFSEFWKWRWQKDHIDLGILSIYGFKRNHLFWRIIAIIAYPMRWNYHRRFKAVQP